MQRFVYTPHLSVFIHHEATGQVIDVSDDIISGSVTRRLNALATAEITIQNKKGKYLATNKASFLFEPMDRIAIYASRIGPPMPIFSGFLDEAPYYQLYPGPVTLRASDALKLLQYTFFDPGVKGMSDLFNKHGWIYQPDTGQITDAGGKFGNEDIGGGMKEVLEDVIENIGGWDADRVQIQELPKKFLNNMTKAMQANIKEESEAFKALEKRITKILSISDASALQQNNSGNVDTTSGTISTTGGGNLTGAEVAQLAINQGFSNDQAVIAVAIARAESTWKSDAINYNSDGSYDLGIWQINTVHSGVPGPGGTGRGYPSNPDPVDLAKIPAAIKGYVNQQFDPNQNAISMKSISSNGTSWTPWSTYNNGAYKQYMDDAQTAVRSAALLGGGGASVPGGGGATVDRTDPNANSIATKIVQIAIGEANKGIRETGGQNQGPEILKYQQYVGLTPGPSAYWCAAFVSWVYGKAGKGDVKEAGAIALRSHGSLTTQPRPGDIVTFDGPENDDHAGIVTSVSGNQFSTVEGNSSDGVFRRGPYTVGGTDNLGRSIGVTRVPGIGLPAAGADQSPIDGSTIADGTSAPAATPQQIAQIAKQSAWFTLQLQGGDILASSMLTGKRALSNDIPLLDWFTRIIPASGRVYMAKPDGTFLAFYPDYFGYYGTSPYFRISDIEIIDLSIQRNDTSLTTHVFATGPFMDFTITDLDRTLSQVASIEDPAFKTFINVPHDDPRTKVDEGLDIQTFMTKYGARPYQLDLPDVRNPILCWVAAWMKLTEFWAQQFSTSASFTFLPEILPGGLVAFGDRISMFVEEVTHNFDRTSGFSTSAQLSSPAALDESRFPWLPVSGQNSSITATQRVTVVGTKPVTA